jgi:amidase
MTCEIEDPAAASRHDAPVAGEGAAPGAGPPAGRANGGPTELDFASAVEAARCVRTGKIEARALTERMLARIDAYDSKLNAVVNVLTAEAMADAARADDALRAGGPIGPLHGVPILIKDAFEIAGVPTTAGLRQFAEYRPAADSEVVRRLRAAGAVVLGNTNVPLALNDWQSYNDLYGTTRNPWDLDRTPGGSSGGSAAALAAGLAYFSPGSDRSGSLRVPASFCGVYAHKPSLGVEPLRGWFPSPPGSAPALSDLISVAGPMARSAADLRVGMQVMGGPDGDEARAYRWSMPAPRHTRLSDYRVGYVLDDPACPVDEPVRERLEAVIEALGKAGVRLRQGWPPGIDPAAQHRTYLYMLFSSLGAPPNTRPEDLKALAARDDGSLASIFAQTGVNPVSRYIDHEREQLRARAAWRTVFQELDVFLIPTSIVAAFPHDHSEPLAQRRLMTRSGPRAYTDPFFWIGFASLSGLPATAAPAGCTGDGLPVGIQILGPHMEDATPIEFAERAAEVIGGFVAPKGF